MRVSKSEYKVISLKAYFFSLAAVVTTFFWARVLIQEPAVLWPFLILLLWLVILFFCISSTLNGKKAMAKKQYPAPGSYVLSSWKVYRGQKAIIYGKYLYWLGGLLSFISFTCVIFLFIKYYTLSF